MQNKITRSLFRVVVFSIMILCFFIASFSIAYAAFGDEFSIFRNFSITGGVTTVVDVVNPTPTPTITPTSSVTPTATATATVTPTVSSTPSVTATPTPTTSGTEAVTPTGTVTVSTSVTASVLPSVTESIQPTVTEITNVEKASIWAIVFVLGVTILGSGIYVLMQNSDLFKNSFLYLFGKDKNDKFAIESKEKSQRNK